jgi:simple sugar transport system ATP-binding protein
VALSQVSLGARGGEIVGIAGVDGNGQREFVEVLTGLRSARGSVRVRGEEVLGRDPGGVRASGVGHVPEDRLLYGIVGAMTVEENLALGRHRSPPFARGVLIDLRGRRARAEALLDDYDVRPRDPLLPAAELSGGNQQKVVLARELDARPPLLIAAHPTRGLDVAAVAAIHDRLRAHRDAGGAVLLVSLDLEELLALSDRLCVLYGGRVIGRLSRGEFDERLIGRWMLGGEEASGA